MEELMHPEWSTEKIEQLKNHYESILSLLGEDVNRDFALEAKLDVISERARLLYVGITRAKERLFITGVRNSKTKISGYFDFLSGK